MKMSFNKTERGFKILANDYPLGPNFTLATGEAAINQLLIVLEPHADELEALARASAARVQWNIDNYPNGRNWPEFSRFEKRFKALQKQAGIKDS